MQRLSLFVATAIPLWGFTLRPGEPYIPPEVWRPLLVDYSCAYGGSEATLQDALNLDMVDAKKEMFFAPGMAVAFKVVRLSVSAIEAIPITSDFVQMLSERVSGLDLMGRLGTARFELATDSAKALVKVEGIESISNATMYYYLEGKQLYEKEMREHGEQS